jgi:VanZ like family
VSRPTLWALAGVVALAVAVIVFLPSSELPSSVVTMIRRELAQAGAPMWLRDADLWERLLNVALFLPLGFVGVLLRPRWPVWVWALVGLVASLVIEVVQIAMPARDGSGWDVATNTTGALLGACLARVVLLLVSSARRRSSAA